MENDLYDLAFYKALEGDEALRERIGNGRLPIIDVAGHPFIVDVRLMALRPVNSFHTSGLDLRNGGHYDDENHHYLFFYDVKGMKEVEIDPDVTEFPKDVVMIKFPDLYVLDPVAMAGKEGLEVTAFLSEYPLKMYCKAEVIPLSETPVAALVRKNREKLSKKGKSGRIRKVRKIISLMFIAMLYSFSVSAQAEVAAAINGAVKKVVKAVDLKIQRQQNKVIWLQNAQKVLENTMSKLKLTEISEWSERHRRLYDDYFTELRKVKRAISTYQKVKSIVNRQLQLVDEYKRSWALLKENKWFSPQELNEMYRIYTGIFNESLKGIEQLILVSDSFKVQMSDGKRLELIDIVDKILESNLVDLRGFNNRNFRLGLSKAKDIGEAVILKRAYGIE
jgi:hypothetical protein